jgi:hypothetical protein
MIVCPPHPSAERLTIDRFSTAAQEAIERWNKGQIGEFVAPARLQSSVDRGFGLTRGKPEENPASSSSSRKMRPAALVSG